MRSEFGQRLFTARKRADKTQQQVAAACGMGQSNYAKLESKASGSVNTPALAAYLGVSVQWLAYGQGEMDVHKEPPPPAAPAESPSATALYLARWLDKVQDQEIKERIAHGAMLEILRVIDAPDLHTTPEQDVPSKTPHASRLTRSR